MVRAYQSTLVPTAKAKETMVLQAPPALEQNKPHQADLSYWPQKSSCEIPSAKMAFPN